MITAEKARNISNNAIKFSDENIEKVFSLIEEAANKGEFSVIVENFSFFVYEGEYVRPPATLFFIKLIGMLGDRGFDIDWHVGPPYVPLKVLISNANTRKVCDVRLKISW